MADLQYPRLILPPGTITMTMVARRDLGPMSIGDTRQMQASAGGFWQAAYSGVGVWTPTQKRLWRAIAWRLLKGQTVALPIYDHRQAPHLPGIEASIVPHDDGAYFADGSGYLTPAIVAELAVAASLRSTTINIRMVRGAPLNGGEYLSIRHPTWADCLYGIDSVIDVADGIYTVGITPPLREDAPAAAPVEFDDPRVTCWLHPDEAMDDTRAAEIMTRRSATFVEWNP